MAAIPLFERFRLARAAGEPAVGTRRFAIIAVLTFALQSAAVVAMNVAINPRSEFPVELVEPIVENERHMKTLHYAKLDKQPEAIILGSSRAWGLPPDALVDRGYAGAYNFAFGGATTEDAQRTLDFVLKHGEAPREIVYAFEDWQLDTLHDVTWSESSPASLGDASRYATLALRSFSLDYARDSWRALEADLDDTPRTWAFQDNGSVAWDRFEAAKLAGTWNVGDASERFLDGARAHYAGNAAPDRRREETLTTLVSEARARGIEVILFLTPMHPEGAALLPGDRYEESVAHARALLLAQCQPGVSVHDLTDPASYGSDLTGFVDGWHFGAGEGRRILDHVHTARGLC